MGMKVECPLLCVHVSFVLVYMDLKCFDTETFFADRGKLLEFLHGGFLFDYYYSSRMGAALACIFCPTVSRYLCFALSADGRCYLHPAFIQMTKFRTNMVNSFP
ncbi:hypothetical protein NXW04_22735 [Phocaeicola vulgatus]|nr:hypothetical protein [Phocaeicola vulgatus]